MDLCHRRPAAGKTARNATRAPLGADGFDLKLGACHGKAAGHHVSMSNRVQESRPRAVTGLTSGARAHRAIRAAAVQRAIMVSLSSNQLRRTRVAQSAVATTNTRRSTASLRNTAIPCVVVILQLRTQAQLSYSTERLVPIRACLPGPTFPPNAPVRLVIRENP